MSGVDTTLEAGGADRSVIAVTFDVEGIGSGVVSGATLNLTNLGAGTAASILAVDGAAVDESNLDVNRFPSTPRFLLQTE